ncbi:MULTISPECIES: methylated-DNA--[protein]-cysteine S-methyltransferase [unclassified Mucilaginibacter]|uniref:methylated-DNA--[protein]-cysteine S-methyltransferase n=1 Tax=unclassified Mucilaginibacter TaxID=2617802 RepID=UPI002AC96102|nr:MULTISPECIES: methylated-DNA--[protein]-cysteine S-methyltransferase [unclassified Mucilaginibacter]MEB0249639.1 methylated-DNA--[protein]-cysteine S-methyltransferase [Mucilaginibacter sp. 5B2]MEB0262979.1 methylated-DNA--[protein]-cysteine S-methyltransferase [Mucilaginibacter sp. 10I4]MEB0280283.1 methylated-DNA--[protein]-cysteine S-methyltransferase [Mucilaginibacter sp. 10B2]MEB0300228.1 methylated-DNA--[protein]-cysteine S-methyltransferase [Mucilaginibacter sp. 5C4]WPX25586.1 methyl
MQEVYHRTPVGVALLVADDTHLMKVSIRDEDVEETTTNSPILLETIKQLDEYFAGDRKGFDLPLNQPGSDFQQTVWQELLNIPYGTTITYNQQSHKMKNPLAIRAIAAANGKNDLWVVVPCHRVIGSNGSLTGYAGGLWRKQWLLEHEARVMGNGQTKLAF